MKTKQPVPTWANRHDLPFRDGWYLTRTCEGFPAVWRQWESWAWWEKNEDGIWTEWLDDELRPILYDWRQDSWKDVNVDLDELPEADTV